MKYDIRKCERVLVVKGWTQTMLAKHSKVSDSAVSNFFNGKSVRKDTAKKIVSGLGLRMEDVVSPRGRVA